MCSSRKYRRNKIIKISGDRFFQTLEYCTGCAAQTNVRLTELKKGNHRDRNS